MNERALYSEITRSFKYAGGFARKAHDAYFLSNDGSFDKTHATPENANMSYPDKGVADYICILPPHYGLAVEVKYDVANLNFKEISPDQRAFLDLHESQAFIWLGMGIRNTRKTWLPTWSYWKQIETLLKGYDLAGLPYFPHPVELRGIVDAPILLASYELVYSSQQQVWRLDHIFQAN